MSAKGDAMTRDDLELAIDDIASEAFEDLCTGDGEHSAELDRNLLRKHLRRVVDRAFIPRPEAPDYKALYHELLYQVATKHPGETRHETAKRYIHEREEHRSTGCQASAKPSPPTEAEKR